MTDDQRDELLTELRVTVATLALTMKTVAEKVAELKQDGRSERNTLFEIVGGLKKRCGELERWRAEESGRAFSRGSAWATSRWVVATLVAVAGICSGLVTWLLS